jgi:hypothetical protein
MKYINLFALFNIAICHKSESPNSFSDIKLALEVVPALYLVNRFMYICMLFCAASLIIKIIIFINKHQIVLRYNL